MKYLTLLVLGLSSTLSAAATPYDPVKYVGTYEVDQERTKALPDNGTFVVIRKADTKNSSPIAFIVLAPVEKVKRATRAEASLDESQKKIKVTFYDKEQYLLSKLVDEILQATDKPWAEVIEKVRPKEFVGEYKLLLKGVMLLKRKGKPDAYLLTLENLKDKSLPLFSFEEDSPLITQEFAQSVSKVVLSTDETEKILIITYKDKDGKALLTSSVTP